ncbi:phosphonate C-P lyase system protein PhnG [Rhizobium laguerreae]|uniref:phosphonate C-P lyase system protein PhnG n=1 Tax=Rhizobium laguerreae TaxID=1076926 RepID=UPI00103FEDEA|nr:phosphonate C-P lyase system protein PhnG [Rhizobium laguerreae]TBX99073.1 hypothetical protein E0J21_33460 [Rhizobium laguerreae]
MGQPQRADWLGILFRSDAGDLDALTAGIVAGVSFEWLRQPHVGLTMVRGRAGGTGQVFSLGESGDGVAVAKRS